MTPFRVWAPDAKSVELDLSGRRIAMSKADGGWWSASVDAPPGTDYTFRVDGGDPRPDPRSPWQPRGVHGPSRTVDHAAFRWTDHRWQPPPLTSAVIYELHVGTFTPQGTFEAAIERLDHLVELGVTHVELMPVNETPGSRNWGYDGVDLFAPQHHYGGPEGLKRFVDACHARGLAAILDVVYNHLGPSGNYLGQFGPYFDSRISTPWGAAINFSGKHSDEVRRLFLDNALTWLRDYHFDGLRLDAVHAYYDNSALHFLEELRDEVDALQAQLGRHLVLIAESDLNDPRIIRPREIGGYGVDAQWNDDFHHALHGALTGEKTGYYADFGSLKHLAAALKQAYVYAGSYSACRARRHGRPPEGVPGHRFLAYLQNHDQIGNRARGERVSQIVSPRRLKIGAALVLTSPFVPMLFQGEEWGASTPFLFFTNHPEKELAEAVRKGRREEFAAFGWKPEDVPNPQAKETFEASRLKWEEREAPPHAELLKWHRDLIALRKRTPDLLDSRLDRVSVNHDGDAGWLTMRRGSILVACNLATQPARVPGLRGAELLLASDPVTEELPAESVVIAKVNPGSCP